MVSLGGRGRSLETFVEEQDLFESTRRRSSTVEDSRWLAGKDRALLEYLLVVDLKKKFLPIHIGSGAPQERGGIRRPLALLSPGHS